ncbi:hypothetical protein [Streptomyces sp. SID3343]|uniref:hypothetical protein n=1 Tax=Streptomyces sp. SID3343 TaxID=2690260 RepID=UPI00136E9CF0|nr:hypothetical protein [Streptomyces sp. SID3343]
MTLAPTLTLLMALITLVVFTTREAHKARKALDHLPEHRKTNGTTGPGTGRPETSESSVISANSPAPKAR